MNQCFIFMKHPSDEAYLSLVLSPQGDIVAPLEERSFLEIKALQHVSKTLIVLSAEQVSFYYLELPWLADKKAQAAIPFALEEKLAENVSDLHFSFDRRHYQDGRYLVAVCNKAWLCSLIEGLKEAGIAFYAVTSDWFALASNEALLLDNSIVIHDDSRFGGSLPETLAERYLKTMTEDQKIVVFPNTNPNLSAIENSAQKEIADKNSNLWIAEYLQKRPYINFCQGALEQGDDSKIRSWSWAAGIASLLWLFSFILFKGISIYQYHSEIKALDRDIAGLYRQFFPGATQVISPKFRISQLLKTQKKDTNEFFWSLLNTLSLGLKNNPSLDIEQIQFQNTMLQVTLLSKDFTDLEALQTFLQKAGVTVKQSEASSKDEKVAATLELSL